MPLPGRAFRRWSLWILTTLTVLLGLYVLLLARPDPLFAHTLRIDGIGFRADQALPKGLEETAAELRLRVAAMEGARPLAGCRVYLCDRPALYTLFARLTRRSPDSLAIGLVAFGNVFVNQSKVRRFATSAGAIRHSRFEGNLAEVVAHEIAHFNVIHAVGLRAALRMPSWKSEGWAEYQANLAMTRGDPDHDLRARIRLLDDLAFWGPGNARARQLFEWQLAVEVLGAMKGYDLRELLDEHVTEDWARQQMEAWAAQDPGN